MLPQDRVQIIKPATADQPKRIIIKGPNLRPQTGKSVRSGSMPGTTNISFANPDNSTKPSKTTYENIMNSITRNVIQDKYRKLLQSFQGLTSQEKLKVISPERVTKVREHSHEVKNTTTSTIFSLPQKKKEEKFEPANLLFPLVPDRPKTTSSVNSRGKTKHRNSLPNASITRSDYEGNEAGRDEYNSSTTLPQNFHQKMYNLKRSSYEPTQDKDTIEIGGETLERMNKTHNNPFTDSERCSIDSDIIFNFKAKALRANHRYQQDTTMDETASIPREGSLMKYFRTQKLRPKTAGMTKKNVVYLDHDDYQRERPQTTTLPARKEQTLNSPSRRQTKNSLFDTSFDQNTDISFAKIRERDSSAFVASQRTRPSTSMAESRNERASISYANSSKVTGAKLVDASHSELSKRVSLSNQRGSLASSTTYQPDVRNSSVPVIWERMSSVPEDSSSRKKDFTSGERSVNNSRRSSSRIALSGRSNQNHDENLMKNIFGVDKAITFEDFVVDKQEDLKESRVAEEVKEEPNEPQDQESVLKNLVMEMRSKMETIQNAMLEDARKEDEADGGNYAQMFALAEIIEAKGGVVQKTKESKLFESNTKERRTLTQDIDKVEEKLTNLERDNEEFLKTVKEGYTEALQTSPAFLTEAELKFLKEEFKRNTTNSFNAEKVDDILLKLKFFEKIEKPIRMGFYKSAKFQHVERGQYIIKDGEYGDEMYVILRGCVDMRIKRSFKDGQITEITVSSLYDGNQFGDVTKAENTKKKGEGKKLAVKSLAQIKSELDKEEREKERENHPLLQSHNKEKQPITIETIDTEEDQELPYDNPRKYASIYTAEECDFLKINREEFKKILVSVLKRDIDDKIKALQLLKFFKKKNEDTEDLVTLANNLGNVQYQMGQRIVKPGDFLDKLYIVAKGRCKAVYEIIEEDVLIIDRFKKKLQNFKYKDFGSVADQANNSARLLRERDIELKKSIPESVSSRTFDNEQYFDPNAPNTNKFRRHIAFKDMAPGDFFGTKPLLFRDDPEKYYQDDDNKSKLTIVADSPVIELYTFDRKSLIYLPDRIKNILLNGLAEVPDFDEVNIQKGIEEHQEWHKFRYDIISKTLTKPDISNLQRKRDTFKAY